MGWHNGMGSWDVIVGWDNGMGSWDGIVGWDSGTGLWDLGVFHLGMFLFYVGI